MTPEQRAEIEALIVADMKEVGRKNKRRGPSYERTVAKILGSKRNFEDGQHRADIYCGPFDVEVKSRLGFKGLVTLMDETKSKSRDGQVPVLALVVRGGGALRYFAVQELTDFADWNCAQGAEDDEVDYGAAFVDEIGEESRGPTDDS
jgi:hypothetical protein